MNIAEIESHKRIGLDDLMAIIKDSANKVVVMKLYLMVLKKDIIELIT
jgi:hypothetical protein